jgi:type IV pilus assembly protein PilA
LGTVNVPNRHIREEDVMFQSVLRRLRDVQNAELEGGGTAEAGFTLIELMVVLLIIAILLAIAIPTFLGVTGSANDRAAQSNLTNGLTEAAAVYQSNNQSFSGILAAVTTAAPEFSWQAAGTAPKAGSNQLSIASFDAAASTDQQGVVIAALSKTNTCWWVAQLSASPASVAGTGFMRGALGAAGGQAVIIPPAAAALITTAGTYYAKSTTPDAAHCTASYIETPAGFNWGTSYASAPANA